MKNIMYLVKDELDEVNDLISQISIDAKEIKNTLEMFLQGSSKRIRTLLCSLYLKANNIKISKESIKIMAIGEVIHNASLLHDDVIDNADKRRGVDTISISYSPTVSILLGDYLLSEITKSLLELDNKKIMNIFLECTKSMCLAEINQYFLRNKIPDIENYISICRGKTSYLFEAILQSCAIVEKINEEDALNMGKLFGILFQLKNDLEFHSAMNDEKNGIHTVKDILGIEKTTNLIDNYQEEVNNFINKLPENVYRKGLEVLVTKL